MEARLLMKKGTEVISLELLFEELIKPGNQVPTEKPQSVTSESHFKFEVYKILVRKNSKYLLHIHDASRHDFPN
jgi:hypothetical protein